MKFLHFLQYHNAVPIAISILLLGAGGAFAATNPEVFYEETETVLSVDNTYIANKDLSKYTPRVLITSVSEDQEYYYVSYTIFTIDVDDHVWKDISRPEVMKVAKADLKPHRDLGAYVTNELKQIVDRELQRLLETQGIERAHVSQKVMATDYNGLVGQLFDRTTRIVPGYEPPPPVVAAVAVAVAETSPPPPALPDPEDSEDADQTPPTIQLLGDNPVTLIVGDSYTDLGVAVTDDDTNADYGLRIYVDGVFVDSVSINTAVPHESTIRYVARDAAGNAASAERTVIVEEKETPPPPPSPEPTPPPPAPEPTPPPPAPEPTPPPPAPEPTPPPPAPAPEPTPPPPSPEPTPPPPSPEPTPPPPPPSPEPPPPPPPSTP